MSKKTSKKKEAKKEVKKAPKKKAKPKLSPQDRAKRWREKQVSTREGKLAKVAGNITHFYKDDLIKMFLEKLSDNALDKVYLESEKIRASKVKKSRVKVRT